MGDQVFTVGHSVHPIDDLVSVLVMHRISAIADVRSSPYSRYNPQFNREPLKEKLRAAGITYVFLGRELGARSEDRNCYIGGKVQYELLARTSLFQVGINRVLEGATKHRISLLCAEKDPLACHRTILVSRQLISHGSSVTHILEDGKLEPHEDAMVRLLGQLRMPETDLFQSREELFAKAYTAQARKIAYVEESIEAGQNFSGEEQSIQVQQ